MKKERKLYFWIVTTFMMEQITIKAHSCTIYVDEGMLIFKRDGRIVYAFQKGSWMSFKEGEFLE